MNIVFYVLLFAYIYDEKNNPISRVIKFIYIISCIFILGYIGYMSYICTILFLLKPNSDDKNISEFNKIYDDSINHLKALFGLSIINLFLIVMFFGIIWIPNWKNHNKNCLSNNLKNLKK